MRRLTARQSFTVSYATKAKLKTSAAERGISMSALVREIIEEVVVLGEFEVCLAERELNGGATVE
jgi:plasmid stability protein